MKILIVDDEESIASLFQDHLEVGDEHEVSVVHSGEAALESVRTEKPDLIILDIMMPGLTGFQVLDALKRDPKTKHIPVILSSVTDGPEHDEKKRLGIIDFVKKPVNFGRLNGIIQDVSRGREMTVLVIEDDEEGADLISMSLEELNCKVRVALDGVEGLKLAKKERPSLIILDYLLPIRSGIDVVKDLKAAPETCDIPVVLISAYLPEEAQGKSFLLLNHADKATGPLSVEDMCRKVKDIVTLAAK